MTTKISPDAVAEVKKAGTEQLSAFDFMFMMTQVVKVLDMKCECAVCGKNKYRVHSVWAIVFAAVTCEQYVAAREKVRIDRHWPRYGEINDGGFCREPWKFVAELAKGFAPDEIAELFTAKDPA